MFSRHLAEVIKQALARMPVATLLGPRQSGKTTLARMAFPEADYVSLESPDERRRATDDPRGFLAGLRQGTVILDEIQRTPDLLSYVQVEIDRPGNQRRFVLTGSHNILLMQGVSQTLAGRARLLHLLSLSLAELSGRPPLVPERLAEVPESLTVPELDCWTTVWSGLFPRVHDQKLAPPEWYASYYHTYVERDLRDVLRVMDVDAFDRFVRLAAAHTGQELNMANLAGDAGISLPTVKQWIGALRTSFLLTLLSPHSRNFGKRLRKHPRLHFLDTGLVCYLLGIRTPEALVNHPLRGAIFESFVVGEVTKAFTHRGQEAPLFFWRDASGHEIDLLVDLGDRLLPVEVKSGMTVSTDMVDGLRWWTGLPGNHDHGGSLIHGGDQFFPLHGFAVRPWFLG
jgi:uncharacterized protein